MGKVSQQYIIIPIIPVVNDSLTAETYIRAIFLFMTFWGNDSLVISVHYHMTKEEKKDKWSEVPLRFSILKQKRVWSIK